MLRFALCVVLAACAQARSEPTRGPVETALHEARRGPIETTARELYADFTRPDAEGFVLLDKYRDGARFTATTRSVPSGLLPKLVQGDAPLPSTLRTRQ